MKKSICTSNLKLKRHRILTAKTEPTYSNPTQTVGDFLNKYSIVGSYELLKDSKTFTDWWIRYATEESPLINGIVRIRLGVKSDGTHEGSFSTEFHWGYGLFLGNDIFERVRRKRINSLHSSKIFMSPREYEAKMRKLAEHKFTDDDVSFLAILYKEKLVSPQDWFHTKDIISSIASDCQTTENTKDFEEWAANMGFDSDSRSAEKTYLKVIEERDRFRSFLGIVRYTELIYETILE